MRAIIFLSCVLICAPLFCLFAQDRQGLAAEVRVTTYLQGGFDFGVHYHPRQSRFTFGFLVAGHDVNGSMREWLFDSNDHDALDIRLNWITSAISRYYFGKSTRGVFMELGAGVEEFEVTSGEDSYRNRNGFIAPSVGFSWYPFKAAGLYIMPKVTGVLVLQRPGEQQFENETWFQLRPAFITPSVALGWKFNIGK